MRQSHDTIIVMGYAEQKEGIILKRANIGEADRIVTFLTPEGKISAVAKGVRRVTSRKASHLELFQRVQLHVALTSGLPIIREAVTITAYNRLRSDLDAASQAFWAAELIHHLVADEAGGSLYPHLCTYLERVNTGAGPLDLRAFELAVLSELGWQPELHHCAHCHTPLAPGPLGWSHSHGGVLDEACCDTQGVNHRVSVETIKALRLLLAHSLAASHRLQVSDAVNAELETVLRTYLESISERPWKSFDMFAVNTLDD